MLKMSCRWWPIWYLLFFCHVAELPEGQLKWVVKEKVTAYGQNLILFCPVENCCSKRTAWSIGDKSIILDIKTFSNDPNVKYHGTFYTDGFGFVIRNLSKADLNVTYHCGYGFDQSTPKYLLHGDVFKEKINVDESCNNTEHQCKDPMSSCTEVVSGDYKCSCNTGYYNNGGTCNIQINVDESCNNTRSPNQCKDPMSNCTEVVSGDYKCSCKPGYYNNGGTCVPDKDKDKENNTVAIVVVIVVTCIILVGAMIMAYFVYRSRIKRKRQKQRGTVTEKEHLYDPENQQEMEVEDLYKDIAEKYGIKPKILEALLCDNTFSSRLMEECRKAIKHHSGVISRDNEYFLAIVLELVTKYQRQQHTEIVDTILNNMSKTLKAQSSSPLVILCHRSVKSAMIKVDEEDYKEQKEVFRKFIEENKFYYNDRIL